MDLLPLLGRPAQVKTRMAVRSPSKENIKGEVQMKDRFTRVRRKDGGGGEDNSGPGNSQGKNVPGDGNGNGNSKGNGKGGGDCSEGGIGCTSSTQSPATQNATPNRAPPPRGGPPGAGPPGPAIASSITTTSAFSVPSIQTTPPPSTVQETTTIISTTPAAITTTPIFTSPAAITSSSPEDTTLTLTTITIDLTTPPGNPQSSFTTFLSITETTIQSFSSISLGESSSTLTTSTFNPSFVAEPSSSFSTSSPITSSRGNSPTPSSASEGISSDRLTRLSTKAQAGIIAGVLIGFLLVAACVILVLMRSRRHRRANSDRSSALPPPFPARAPILPHPSSGWFMDVEPALPPLPPLPSQRNSSTGPTVTTGEILPATSSPTYSPSPGLSNNPVPGNIIRSGGYVKTIIKPTPFQTITQVDIKSRKQVPRIQTTDIYIQEQSGLIVNIPTESSESISRKSSLLPFEKSSDDGQRGKSELLTVDHKPAGRWSDPFTVGWRGSGEPNDGGNRWKNAKSWVRDQTHRLEVPGKKTERRSGVTL